MASGVQKLVNKVKSGAREIADSLTPTLKVSPPRLKACEALHLRLSAPVLLGVKVQREWDDYSRGVRGSWGPPCLPLPYMDLVSF